MKQRLYLFDFDGTLTNRDSFLEFIRYAKGTPSLLWGLMLHAPLLVLMKCRLYPNGKAKQKLFAHFFKGMGLDDFDLLCQQFAHDNRDRLLRPLGVATLEQALRDGATVFIVSASIDRWIKPFFPSLPDGAQTMPDDRFEVIATQPEVTDERLTGRFSTPNCNEQEKVKRIADSLKHPRSHYDITAFGDSQGDKAMLQYADQGHYKPFRP